MNGFDPNSGAIVESAPKEILSSNLHKNNVMSWEKFYEIVTDTLHSLESYIIPLCGKDACHSMVIHHQMTGEFNTNVFTNDGIHVLKTIEFLSPIQTYITNYVKYVADKVESAAADGTSTAILLTIWYIQDALDKANAIRMDKDTVSACNALLHNTHDTFVENLQGVRNKLKDLKIDLKEMDLELRKQLIYQLALTSSKGNEILSEYAVDIYIDLPEELHQLSMFRKENVETETKFRIEHVDYDASLNVQPSSTIVYNKDLYTRMEHDGIMMVVLPENIGAMDGLIEYIETLKETEDHVLLLTYTLSASEETLLTTKFDANFLTVCMHTNFRTVLLNNPLELMSVLAIAGKQYAFPKQVEDFEALTIKDIKVEVVGGNTLRLYDLHERNENHIHPLYLSKDSEFYNRLVADIGNRIRQLKDSHHHGGENKGEIAAFLELFRGLVCHSMPTLVIGGSTHDILANIDVVNDVLGVVSVAMKNGVVLDTLPKLANLVDNDSRFIRKRLDWFVKYLYGRDLFNVAGDALTCLHPTLTGSRLSHYTKAKLSDDHRCGVVQSYKAIDETYKRIIETIPKLIQTENVMVPNSIV